MLKTTAFLTIIHLNAWFEVYVKRRTIIRAPRTFPILQNENGRAVKKFLTGEYESFSESHSSL